jgi:hypothetical protein
MSEHPPLQSMSLTTYPNLEVLEALSAEDLRKQLIQIYLPYKIIALYAVGVKHYAWISTTKPVNKVKAEKEKVTKKVKTKTNN